MSFEQTEERVQVVVLPEFISADEKKCFARSLHREWLDVWQEHCSGNMRNNPSHCRDKVQPGHLRYQPQYSFRLMVVGFENSFQIV